MPTFKIFHMSIKKDQILWCYTLDNHIWETVALWLLMERGEFDMLWNCVHYTSVISIFSLYLFHSFSELLQLPENCTSLCTAYEVGLQAFSIWCISSHSEKPFQFVDVFGHYLILMCLFLSRLLVTNWPIINTCQNSLVLWVSKNESFVYCLTQYLS